MLQKSPTRDDGIPRWAASFGVTSLADSAGRPTLLVAGTMAGVFAVPASSRTTRKEGVPPVSTTDYALITCFRQPAPPSSGRGRLLRGIPPARAFDFVEIVQDVADDTPPRTDGLSGRYELLHAGTTPAAPFTDAPGAESVVFVNCMEFDPDRHDEAFALWRRVNAYMVHKPGYRWHRLHRRTSDQAPFGLVNVVEWESVAAWQAAHDEGFRELAADPPFVARPTLCLPVTT